MEKRPEFDEIRPFYDEEVARAIELLLNNPDFQRVMSHLFSSEEWKKMETKLRTFTNVRDFQHLIIKNLVFDLLRRTGSSAKCEGFENVSPQKSYIYISNHRDIILDSAILCSILAENGYETVEIAIGDNLILSEWIKYLVRLNKSFLVKRNLSIRETFVASQLLSKYIHFTIKDKNQSIWIAQREGRAKDSNDSTQDSLLKMLAMGGEKNFISNLMDLNLTPLTFSYEYDPCDFLKAKEFQQKRDIEGFKKTPADDLLNMRTGVFGHKGRIHLQIGRGINPTLKKLDSSLHKNELATLVASIIDKEIFLNYKFFPINYIAYDRLWGKDYFKEKYTNEDIKKYEDYLRQQLDKIDLLDKDINFLREKMEEMYANPVRNYLLVSS